MIVHVSDDASGKEVTVTADNLPLVFPERGFLLVLRDKTMDTHQEEEGSVPMADGESSLALWFNPIDGEGYYLDMVTVEDPLKSKFAWWALEQMWEAYLFSKRATNTEKL